MNNFRCCPVIPFACIQPKTKVGLSWKNTTSNNFAKVLRNISRSVATKHSFLEARKIVCVSLSRGSVIVKALNFWNYMCLYSMPKTKLSEVES